MEGVAGPFPVETKAEIFEINGNETEVLISKFSDKHFVVISQYGKVGNLVEVRRDVANPDDQFNSVYSIRVLLGRDDEDIHVAARYLVNFISSVNCVVFALSLKDYKPETVRKIAEHLKVHPSIVKSA